jgi:hypothetical protein
MKQRPVRRSRRQSSSSPRLCTSGKAANELSEKKEGIVSRLTARQRIEGSRFPLARAPAQNQQSQPSAIQQQSASARQKKRRPTKRTTTLEQKTQREKKTAPRSHLRRCHSSRPCFIGIVVIGECECSTSWSMSQITTSWSKQQQNLGQSFGLKSWSALWSSDERSTDRRAAFSRQGGLIIKSSGLIELLRG